MLTEQARVVAIEADSLWVETIRQSTCGTCAAQKGCGHGLLNKIAPGRVNYVRVLPGSRKTEECRVDDQVLISIPEEVILRGSMIAYLLPLFCMLLGAAVFVSFLQGSEDLLAAFGAVSGLIVGFALVRWHGIRHLDDSAYQPTLVEVVRSTSEPIRFI